MALTLTQPAVRIGVVLAELADCVCAELATSGAGPTCWCGLYPGAEVSWEFCGECDGARCGMGWVRLAGVFPYSVFPNPVVDLRCVYPLGWTVEVGALRCVPMPPDGELPSPDQLAEVVMQQVADAGALHRALQCCGVQTAVDTYNPVGPQGACVGGFWTAFLAVD